MSYRCVIVDDEKPARDRVKRLLADHPDFECVGQAHDADSAVRLIDESRPDLCFLDVQMPEGDGFSVLERVKKMPAVVFTTAYDEYAVRAFDVRSLDYLLKPFDKRRFAEALERARKMLQQPAIPTEQILELLEEFRRGPNPAAPRISGKPLEGLRDQKSSPESPVTRFLKVSYTFQVPQKTIRPEKTPPVG